MRTIKTKPVLAFTMGDPAGIGPEILVRALSDPRVRRACTPWIMGCRDVLRRRGWRPTHGPILDVGLIGRTRPGYPTIEGGRASFEAVRLALNLAGKGVIDAIVTAPVSKRWWSRAGVSYRDHTEYLMAALDVSRAAMMLLAGKLRAVLATRHISMKDVPRYLSSRAVMEAAHAAHFALMELGLPRPRLGLCAFNPHAGEEGLLGREETRLLAPAVRRLRRAGLSIDGPLPADAAWVLHQRGRYDALVALYHDQALIPLKLADPYGVVNWTAGLPVIRTSPGHGTAFDIAGSGRAVPEAMVQAALLAARLAQARSHRLPSPE